MTEKKKYEKIRWKKQNLKAAKKASSRGDSS